MIKYHAKWLILCVVISGLTGCKTQLLQTSPQSFSVFGRNVIPLSFYRDVPVVTTKINGKGPYRLVIDSALGISSLTPQAIEEINPAISSYEYAHPVKRSGKVVSAEYRRIDKIEIGNVTLRNMDITYQNLQPNFFGKDEKIDGVLSIRAFLRMRPTIDYPNKQLILEPYKPLKSDAPNVMQAVLSRSLIQKLYVYVADRKLPCVIDTSSPYGLLLLNLTGLGLPFVSQEAVTSEPFLTPYFDKTKSKAIRVVSSQLNSSFYLGGHRVSQPTLHNLIPSKIADASPRELELLAVMRMSILGGGILKHFAVTFDLRNSRIQFNRPDETPLQINPKHEVAPNSEPDPKPLSPDVDEDSVASIHFEKSST